MVNVKAAPFSLSPFFHIPLDHKGLTILVCVVNDVLNRDRGMAWFSQSGSRSNSASYYILGKEDTQSAVSFPSLVSSWDTYTCFISHRNMIQLKAGHNYGLPKSRIGFDNDNIKCSHPEHQSFSAECHEVPPEETELHTKIVEDPFHLDAAQTWQNTSISMKQS
ncbi:hypothetical protein C0J50_11582 [Silurus asotus]|uniref:Ig-like domain-containing protein n=1 Tax=Silurus asotus TaxID=30991 RepID=A0AAD5ACQ7_SILAS|nr:hypothetical protein C0J50_11582 [Silurus asotus]